MADKKPFYLTTTLPYVNAAPHVGFALELVQADIIARHHSLMGEEVFFNTGTDEHGQKIFQKAREEGKDVQAYVDEYAAKFRDLKKQLNLSDQLHFVRTTDPHHVVAAQELWKRAQANMGPDGPDIYLKKYKGLYCVGDEAFVKESDLVDGKCPNHPSMELVEIEEENYFFRLSRYQVDIEAYLSQDGVIVPEWRRLEALQFVQKGLEDFSISRVKEKMPWGVPVPGDDAQVMYVWFDALTNYISTLGWPEDKEGNFKKFWEEGEALQLAGKDQVRFQSIMWQAMLMSAKIKNTDKVLYHGFITSGGQKMSKSLGNVIDPMVLVDEYGIDALRYFLAGHVSPFEDTDVTLERFKEVYNAFLANGLGNLVSRVMQLASAYNVVFSEDVTVLQKYQNYITRLEDDLVNFNIEMYVSRVGLFMSSIDEKITQEKPFKVIKEDRKKGETMIQELLHDINQITKWIEPIMPSTSEKIKEAIIANKKPDNLFPRKE